MARQHQIGKVATSVFTEDGLIKVVYHSTVVVAFNDRLITLNTGGWRTATTKTRMNQTSSEFGLGYNIFQKNFKWFARHNGEVHKFNNDGILLHR